MRKINEHSPETFPNAGIDLKMDPMRTGIPGRKRKVRRGRNARMTRMNEYCANDGKKIGTHAKVTTTKSSWHQTSRKYECEWNRKPIEMIFRTSSHVKTARKKVSQWPMNSSFHVPFGSSGDSHAIVKQFAAIVTAINGSNHLCSMISIARRRTGACGGRALKARSR